MVGVGAADQVGHHGREVEGVTGQYFANSRPKRSNPASYDVATAKRLWEVSEQLVSLEEARS